MRIRLTELLVWELRRTRDWGTGTRQAVQDNSCTVVPASLLAEPRELNFTQEDQNRTALSATTDGL